MSNIVLPWICLVLIAILWWRTRRLAVRLSDAELHIAVLERRGAQEAMPGYGPEAAPGPESAPAKEAAPALAVPAAQPPPLPPQPATPMEPPEERYLVRLLETTGGWEALIGGNLLNKLGALVSVIGIALFLNFSFAHMGPAGRSFTGLAISLALLGSGLWWERSERYRGFALGLIGAGWASLYFTAFAMHAVNAARIIESPSLGAALMTAVAAGMVAHSLRYRVQTVSMLSFGCVFAALALGESNLLVAVAIVPVAAAMLYLAHRFDWPWMPLFAAAATYATFLTRPSSGSPLAQIELMLLLYWVIFEAFDILRDKAWPPHLFALNAVAGIGASAAIWYRLSPGTMARYCLLAAAAYWVSTVVRLIRRSNALAAASLILSSILAGLSIFAHMEGIWLPLATALEAEVLFAAYLAIRMPVARTLAFSAFGFAIRHAFALHGSTVLAGAIIHDWAPPIAVIALMLHANRYLAPDRIPGYAASALTAIVIASELPWAGKGTGLLIYALLLLEAGARLRLSEFRYQATVLLIVGAGFAAFSDNTVAYVTATGLAMYVAIRAVNGLKELHDWERRVLRHAGSIASVLLGTILATRFGPARYDALAMTAASVLLFELALRGFPAELRRPAIFSNLVSLALLFTSHGEHLVKQPPVSVWASFGIAALLYIWITFRTLSESGYVRRAAPPLAAGLLLLTLWMVLPAAWVPIGIIAVAIGCTVVGPLDLSVIGRVVSVIAVLPVYETGELTLAANSALTVAAHLWLGRRVAGQPFVSLHPWIAAEVSVLLFRIVWPGTSLIATAVLAAAFGFGRLRWQSVAIAALCLVSILIGQDPVWQRATAAILLAAPLLYESRDGTGGRIRAASGLAAALTGAVTLFREASGGMLTVTWGVEAIALLSAGFALRERPLRLGGLALLLVCIGKAFVYDLRQLDTFYRILSFTGLGAILLAVSWLYNRFRDTLRRYL